MIDGAVRAETSGFLFTHVQICWQLRFADEHRRLLKLNTAKAMHHSRIELVVASRVSKEMTWGTSSFLLVFDIFVVNWHSFRP